MKDKMELAVQELRNIVKAKRYDKDVFADDSAFVDWVRSRAKWVLGQIEPEVGDLDFETVTDGGGVHLYVSVGEDSVDLNEFDHDQATAMEVVSEADDDALGMFDYIPNPAEPGHVDQHYMLHNVRSVVSSAGILSAYIRQAIEKQK
jgi:hypothetical protein